MNPRLPYNPYRVPLPNSLARPVICQLGPTKTRFQVPFDLHFGLFTERLSTRFHYFAANIAAKVDQQYIPVEISIVEFSFQQGIIRSYHKVLEQNNIPKGLSYDCALQMMKHRIDAEARSQEGDKLGVIFREIAEFFDHPNVIVVFCEDLKLEQNISILNWLQQKYR